MAISEPLAAVLRAARDELNAEFLVAKRALPALDKGAFFTFLEGALDPVVVAVHTSHRDRVADVARAGYAVGLDVVGQRVGARSTAVEQAFTRLLPRVPALVARAPAELMGAFVNAVYNLEAAGARSAHWVDVMSALGPRCATVEEILTLGQLCAWTAGLSHYRLAALQAADALPFELTQAALGIREGVSWPDLRASLEVDPWFALGAPREPRVAGVVGAFRGYGGLFGAPPRVSTHGDHLLVESPDSAHLLVADAFGATFHRATEEEVSAARRDAKPADVSFDGRTLSVQGTRLELPIAGEVTSVAATATTLAVTSAFTHAVVLVALGAPG